METWVYIFMKGVIMNADIVEATTDSIERCYIHTYQECLKFYLNSDGYKIKRTTITFDGSPYILLFEKQDGTMLEIHLVGNDPKGVFYSQMREMICKGEIKERFDKVLRFL